MEFLSGTQFPYAMPLYFRLAETCLITTEKIFQNFITLIFNLQILIFKLRNRFFARAWFLNFVVATNIIKHSLDFCASENWFVYLNFRCFLTVFL